MTGTTILSDGSIQIVIPLPPVTKKNHQQICWKKLLMTRKHLSCGLLRSADIMKRIALFS